MTGPARAADWQEYLAAARSLDSVRREATGAMAAATRVASAARADVARVRARLDRQHAELARRARRRGGRPVRLVASAAERAAAARLVGGDPAAVAEALRQCRNLLRAADEQLSAGTGRPAPGWAVTAAAAAVVVLVGVAVVALLLPR
jgi:hypothetical protein